MRIVTAFFVLMVVPNIICLSIDSSLVKTFLGFFKSKSDEILEKASGNTQCASDLKALFTDLVNRKLWAFEMLDASGKVPSGMLGGNCYSVGSFDQCLNIHTVRDANVINGQYCTVVLLPGKKFPTDLSIMLDSVAMVNYLGYNVSYHAADILKLTKFTYGLCIPESCSIGNLQKIWDYIENTFRIPVHIFFVDRLCRSRGKPIEPYSIDEYIYTAFGVYLFIVLASTWYDVMIHQNFGDHRRQQSSYWIIFSLYTNTRKLFSNPKKDTDGYLECLNGIKVLTMMWVILGHRILLNLFFGAINGIYIFEWSKNIENSFILAASYSVDSFLLLSGLLLSYSFLKFKSIVKKERNMPLAAFYLHRFLRLSPGLLALILFYISIFKTLSDGPIWPVVATKFGAGCLHTWWATLMFASNLIEINYQCVEQAWYLAVDSQLYIIAPIILINLERKPWRTICACLGACIVSALYTFIITIKYNYGAIYFEANKPYLEHVYQTTFVRMPPWLIGIMLGYLIFKYQHVRIPQRANLFLWISSLSLIAYLILIHLSFTRNDYDPVRSAWFNSCARPAWAIAVGIIVFSCVSGHGGAVNQFLSLPVFQVLARVSYSIYLVHLGVLAYFVGGKKNPEYFSNIKGVHDFAGDMFFILIVGVIWCLLFESPFMALSKMMINKAIAKELVVIPTEPKKKRHRKSSGMSAYLYSEGKSYSEEKFKSF